MQLEHATAIWSLVGCDVLLLLQVPIHVMSLLRAKISHGKHGLVFLSSLPYGINVAPWTPVMLVQLDCIPSGFHPILMVSSDWPAFS